MKTTSAHVIPDKGQWILFNPDGRKTGEFTTQREAISRAKGLVEQAKIGQVVVHSTSGNFRVKFMTGLPKLSRPTNRNAGDRTNVRKAISSAIRERLMSTSQSSSY